MMAAEVRKMVSFRLAIYLRRGDKLVSILPTNLTVITPYLNEVRSLADMDNTSEVAGGGFHSDLISGTSTSLSEGGALLGQVLESFSRIGRMIDSLSARRSLDVSEGIGLLEGAAYFGSQVAAKYSLQSKDSSFLGPFLSLLAERSPLTSLFEGGHTGIGHGVSNLFTNHAVGSVLNQVQPDFPNTGPFAASLATPFGVGSVAGGLQAASSVYQLFDKWGQIDPKISAISGAASGAYIGSTIMPGVGTAVGAVIGGVLGVVGGLMKTGKHDDQLARDQVRALLQQRGCLDESFSLRLADGSKYDIGKDGGHQLASADGSARRTYEIDTRNPLSHEVIGMVQPFVSALVGGNPKLTSDFTGYFTNAALFNASNVEEAKENIRAFLEQFQLDPDAVIGGVAVMADQGIISREVRDAYLNGIRSLYTHTR